MNWRPDGWENPHPHFPDAQTFDDDQIFEAGADAILEALKSEAVFYGEGYNIGLASGSMALPPGKGWLVFISEEEDEKTC